MFHHKCWKWFNRHYYSSVFQWSISVYEVTNTRNHHINIKIIKCFGNQVLKAGLFSFKPFLLIYWKMCCLYARLEIITHALFTERNKMHNKLGSEIKARDKILFHGHCCQYGSTVFMYYYKWPVKTNWPVVTLHDNNALNESSFSNFCVHNDSTTITILRDNVTFT